MANADLGGRPARATGLVRFEGGCRLLLRNSCCRLERDEFETQRFGFSPKFDFLSFLMAQLVSGKVAVVELLTGRDEVENDARQFVCSCGDGLGSTQFGSHAAIEVAQRTLAVMQRLGCHAQCGGSATVYFSRSCPKHFAPADLVVGAYAHPGSKRRSTAE